MKLLGFDKVLCLCPHPDDVEYSISGTIMKYRDTEFHVLFMSQGTIADASTSQFRIKESNQFWDNLLLDNFHKHLMPNTTFIQFNFDKTLDSEWISAIESSFEMWAFDAILATSGEDSHYEHIITNRVLKSLGRANPTALIEYKSPSTLHSWEPNFFVELDGNTLKSKIFHLKEAFKSQGDAGYFSEKCMLKFNEDFIAQKRGIEYVEQYKILSMYGL